MTIDLSNPSGFSKFWDDIVSEFRKVAIDDPNSQSSGNLTDSNDDPVLNDHIKGPVDGQTLAAQYDYPVAWSVPQSWTPAYETSKSDQGQLQVMVVVFAADQDQEYGFRKARELSGRIVNNVEDNRDLNGQASATWLENFQMDFLVGEARGQLQYGQMIYQIDAKRLLT